MTTRLDFPEGGWVAFKDAVHITERARRPIQMVQVRMAGTEFMQRARDVETRREAGEVVEDVIPDEVTADLGTQLNDLMLLAFVADWSFDATKTLDGLLDLPGYAYSRMQRDVAGRFRELFPDFTPDGGIKDGVLDPASPTQPS